MFAGRCKESVRWIDVAARSVIFSRTGLEDTLSNTAPEGTRPKLDGARLNPTVHVDPVRDVDPVRETPDEPGKADTLSVRMAVSSGDACTAGDLCEGGTPLDEVRDSAFSTSSASYDIAAP